MKWWPSKSYLSRMQPSFLAAVVVGNMLLRFKESEEDEVVRKTTLREAGFSCFGNIISRIIMNVVTMNIITVRYFQYYYECCQY